MTVLVKLPRGDYKSQNTFARLVGKSASGNTYTAEKCPMLTAPHANADKRLNPPLTSLYTAVNSINSDAKPGKKRKTTHGKASHLKRC